LIIEYHRPRSLEHALQLLTRKQPWTLPMGGGTQLSRTRDKDFAVVDLQDLGLDTIEYSGPSIQIGAAARLAQLVESPLLPTSFREAARREHSYNIRQMATIGGVICAAAGKSPLLTTLLAMDANLTWLPDQKVIPLGEWLPLRGRFEPGVLLAAISFSQKVEVRYDLVARTPADQPMVCVGVARWPSGRTRIAIGSDGPRPVLAMDGPDVSGAEESAQNACSQFDLLLARQEYITDISTKLIRRLLS
jgi:CO/xanthine dehydrogenase FAD-binding subunit